MPLLTSLDGSAALKSKADALYQNTPDYDLLHTVKGDVLFSFVGDGIVHGGLVADAVGGKVHSDPERGGVVKMPMLLEKHSGLVFRFFNLDVAAAAARLAIGWTGENEEGQKTAKTGYSSVRVIIPLRALHAGFGSCKFGQGAQARLLKYRSRPDCTPKNVTCAEMVLLAYQLAMAEDTPGFPKLDAKHCTPAKMLQYFLDNDAYWTPVARRRGVDKTIKT